MPAPPPNGRVVDAAVRVGRAVARVVQAHVEQAARCGPCPSERRRERAGEVLGEDREDVDAHGRPSQLEQARRAESTTTRPASCSTTNTHRHQRAAVEHEQVVRGVRLDRRRPAELGAGRGRRPRRRSARAPTASSSGVVGERRRRAGRAPRSASAASRSSTPVEAARASGPGGAWMPRSRSVARRRRTARAPGSSAFGAVGREATA